VDFDVEAIPAKSEEVGWLVAEKRSCLKCKSKHLRSGISANHDLGLLTYWHSITSGDFFRPDHLSKRRGVPRFLFLCGGTKSLIGSISVPSLIFRVFITLSTSLDDAVHGGIALVGRRMRVSP
jgi:hypothetical protein